MAIRFHLDEHIHSGIAVGLRARGVSVTLPAEVGLLGVTDHEHIAFALREHRVIVSHDDDFLRLHSDGVHHAGIAYCHRSKYALTGLLRALLLVHACYSAEELQNRVEYL